MKNTYEILEPYMVDKYFSRIGLSDEKENITHLLNKKSSYALENFSILEKLIIAHQRHIPFENLDVYEKKLPISLDIKDLYNKVIENKRGGYCFELNELFVILLRTINFDAWSCICRVVRGKEEVKAVSHRGIIVKIDDNLYFCDVGFGGPMPRGAVLLESFKHQNIFEEEFYPVDNKNGWWSLNRITKGKQDNYDNEQQAKEQTEIMFQTAVADPVDFLPLNAWVSEREESIFTQHIICNINTEDGYKSINDNTFICNKCNIIEKQNIVDKEKFYEILKEHFGIVL